MNILFTCAGRRTYLLKYFREQLAGQGKIIGADMQLTAPALSAADIRVQVPAVYNPNYLDVLRQICVEHHVDVLISLNDLELPILSENKKSFEEIGVNVLVSKPALIKSRQVNIWNPLAWLLLRLIQTWMMRWQAYMLVR